MTIENYGVTKTFAIERRALKLSGDRAARQPHDASTTSCSNY
jgi:hypothetical protein